MTPRRWLPVFVVALAACGGAVEPVGQTTAVEPPADDEQRTGPHRPITPSTDDDGGDDDGIEVEGTRGHLEQVDIEDGVRPHQAALSACYHDQLRGKRFLGGKIELAFVVGGDGKVRSVAVGKSDLGSWAVERCMLEVGKKMAFVAPRGKTDADFALPLDLDSGKGNLIWWTEEEADREVAAHLADLDACSAEAEGSPSNVWVTLYVGPRGKVKSIGFASPSGPIDDGWNDCVVEKAESWSLADPKGRVAKAGFRYRPE